MRASPAILAKYRAVDVACVLASEFFSLDDLTLLPALTSGFKSVTATLDGEAAQAVETARLVGLKTTSIGQLKSACDEVPGEGGTLYEVDKATLGFRKVSGASAEVAAVKAALLSPPSRRASKIGYADPAQPFEIALKHGVWCTLKLDDEIAEPIGLTPYNPADRQQPDPFRLTFDDLVGAAQEMDEIDAADGGPRSDWAARLIDPRSGEPRLRVLSESETFDLEDAPIIAINGSCHVLGLPGTGKTTLIMLMTRIAAARGLRLAAFTTSVAAADELRRMAARYGVGAELVYGSSPQSKARHAIRYADLIAAEHGDSGFGHTSPSAMRFATGCALEGYVPEDRFDQVQRNSPPCRSIRQGGKEGLFCPLIGACGRHQAARSAVTAQAWFGHMSILETPVPSFLSQDAMTYAELVGRHFDIVFIDEADAAQKSLDEKGIDKITLSGSTRSPFTDFIVQMAGSTLQVRVEWSNANDNRIVNAANHILRHLGAFQKYVMGLDGERPHKNILSMIDGNLLNTSSVIASLHSLMKEQTAKPRDDFYQLGAELEGALRTVYFFDEERDAQRIANKFHDPALAYNGTLINGLVEDPLAAISELFLNDLQIDGHVGDNRKIVSDHVRILCHVISCVVHVDAILRTLPYIRQIGDGELLQGNLVSREVLALIAESVVGHVSGLKVDLERHPVDRTITSLKIDYEAYRGTPRLLPDRLVSLPGETRGPHVVSLSATSFMPASRTFHLGREPDYILSRANGDGETPTSGYKFVFAPCHSGEDATPIAVSGAGLDREVNLRKIIRETFSDRSERYRGFARGVDAERKMAIVVNSYEQVDFVLSELERCNPALRNRTIGITREYDGTHRADGGFHTAQEAALLGRHHGRWDCIVFPSGAFGRGVNLVFPSGHSLENKALIGTMFFPIRPHPSLDDPTFLQGKLASLSEAFDQFEFAPGATPADISAELERHRYRARDEIRSVYALSGSPLSQASHEDAESFAANILVDLGQVMGRAIRGGVEANMVFLDAAWCPRTAAQSWDTPSTSLLLRMAKVIDDTVNGSDRVHARLMHELYGNILAAVRAAETIRTQPDQGEDDVEYQVA